MKKLSKRLSLFVCLTIIANLLVFSAPVVLASNSEAEVLYKSSFSDYIKDGSPKGWTKAGYITQKVDGVEQEVENTGSFAYSVIGDNNNYLKLEATSESYIKDIIPFNKVVSDGKIHISFDNKIPDEAIDTNSAFALVLFNMHNPDVYRGDAGYNVKLNDYDPYNLYDFRGNVGYQQTHIMRVPYTNDDTGIRVSKTGTYWSATNGTQKFVKSDSWNHFDVIMDLDKNTYDIWLNGEKITTDIQGKIGNGREGNDQFKGMGFLFNGSKKIGFFDNVIVTHYTNNDQIQMVADAGKEGIGISAADGKYLNISFNDTLKNDFRDEDFVITADDGSVVNNVKVSDTNKTKYGCILDFNAATGLKGNTNYTVTYNASNTGLATEANANGKSASFRTNAISVDTSANDYKYYYAKENFDEFTDSNQLPFGIVDYKYQTSNYNENYNKYLSDSTTNIWKIIPTDGSNGGKAMRIRGGAQAYYYFPRGIITGDFTAEFDMKYQNVGIWSMGFAPYRNWLDTAIESENDAKLKNKIMNNSLIGMGSNNGSKVAPNLYITESTADGHYSQPYMNGSWNKDTGIDINEDEWAHVKLDFDMAEGNVDITVSDINGNNPQVKENVSYGAWNKFGAGVEGLYFYKSAFGTETDNKAYLDIDNLEVYTKSGKLLDQNFNGYSENALKRFPYFWTSENAMKNIVTRELVPSTTAPDSYKNAVSCSGATGEESDKALKLYRNTNGIAYYMTMFNKQVPAGESYAVEFDLKYQDDNTTWVYGPVDAARTVKLVGYNDLRTSGNAQNYYANSNLVAMTGNGLYSFNGNNSKSQTNIDANATTIKNTNYFNKIDGVDLKGNTWNHYKIIAVPNDENTVYTVVVDNEKTYTFTDKLDYNKKDIAGIAFQIANPNATDLNGEWGIMLDNVSAYLCDSTGKEIKSARENSILDIEAEKLNGDTVSLMNTNEIPYSTKKITVTFSENLDETLKKDLTPITLSNNGVTGTTTAVYDCIEDVIQLRSKNAAYPMDYTAEIDGNKFIITLNDVLSSDTTYSLHIAKNVSFASSPYSTLDNGFSRTYTGVVDPDGGFKLTSCKAVVKSGDSWKEVTSFADITSGEANLGLKFNVTNVTGAAKNIRAVAAFYDESGELAELVNVGIFDQVIESEADAQTPILEIAMPTLSEGKSYTTVKFFAWDADSSAPLKRPQTFTNVTE